MDMAVSSAAELQKRHALEGTPEPFLSLVEEGTPVKARAQPQEVVDTDSHSAFPSLAPSAPAPAAPARSAWGAGPRIKATVKTQPMVSDSFTLSAIELPTTRDGKPTSLGENMKLVMSKFKVKIEASANQRTRQTTFHMKSESQKELDKAKRSLLALLSPKVTLTLLAPASTIPVIIGTKGATLKQIRDQTGVRVDIPRKDDVAPNGQTNGHASGAATPSAAEEDEEPTVPVTITGPQPLAYEAQAMLNEIISARTSQSTQRVKDIPAHILPFVTTRRALFIDAAQGVDVYLTLNAPEREITVSGDREAVVRVVDSIKSTIETFKVILINVKITLPKRQHRLLVGQALDEIMAKSKCSVVVPEPEEPGEEVVVYGKSEDISAGLGAVMEKANSQYIHEFPLPGPIAVSRQLLTYMTRIDYPKTLSTAHPGALIFTPSPNAIAQASVLNIDIVGEKPVVDGVVRQVSELLGKLIGATKDVSIDWLIHRIIMGKNAKKLKQFYEVHNVSVFFPPESAEQSSVLLVYDPLSPSASPSPVEKEKHVDEVAQELLKMAKEAADVKSETVSVEKRWHEAVVGRGGTTLNAIIGEDKTLSIKVGAEVGDASTEDVILVRGASADVDRAVKEILKVVEDAKNDAIVSSYVQEFDIDREYVGRVVGAQGAGVNKLREQLGVKVDVSDDVDEKEKETSKKKKPVHQKSKVKITGRKENVEEAKKRILAQVERLADETSETIKIPSQYHASLIGQNGKYAIRLEEKYAVKITFPRQFAENGEGKTREQLKLDEVLIKGGKKGSYSQVGEAANASEIQDADPANIVKVSGSKAACEAAIAELKARVRTAPTPVETVTAVVSVPLKYHHAISQQGSFFRNLRSYGVQVDQSAQPQKSAVPTQPPQTGAPTARIDDAEDDTPESVWQVIANYQDAEEGDSEWTLKARDAAGLERAQSDIKTAIEQAEAMSHVGFLTLADRSAFPRIVGSKGSNVSRLRAETGADITVSRENNTIVIIGSESAVEEAKEAILKQAASPPRSGRR
ncbi:hypothetical protein HYDPIDRAFT_37535 [Hydnomerulius pinastri MD-312]|nr:hypothetical protein HYDPIDRAFT_37535 [Hydnomerulius pinastri MD-312]